MRNNFRSLPKLRNVQETRFRHLQENAHSILACKDALQKISNPKHPNHKLWKPVDFDYVAALYDFVTLFANAIDFFESDFRAVLLYVIFPFFQ